MLVLARRQVDRHEFEIRVEFLEPPERALRTRAGKSVKLHRNVSVQIVCHVARAASCPTTAGGGRAQRVPRTAAHMPGTGRIGITPTASPGNSGKCG
ncbi:hypothetical protein BvRS1_05970 [Burkholderia vietnamiensis]|nr:hypothetical protein BvRS1_05970 [Burkholderia vietnamiensis]